MGQKDDGLDRVRDDLRNAKALDYLLENAKVKTK